MVSFPTLLLLSKNRIACFAILLLASLCASVAQPARRDTITWGEFVEYYFDNADDNLNSDDQATERLALLEDLETLHTHPLNINTCTRDDLLQIPFLQPYTADAIIAYRDRRGFFNLGELLLIPSLSYAERLYLPLFLYIGAEEFQPPTLSQMLTRGKAEVETRLDIPLYTRAGNGTHTTEELQKYPNRIYYGNGLRNVVRLRYQYAKTLAYGITLEKDPGEPFAARSNYPYDYTSFYIHRHGKSDRYEWIIGDYELRSGQGLLFSGGYMLSKTMVAAGANRGGSSSLKPHTSTEENAFFRGLAGRMRFGNVEATAFASYRTLDASYQDGHIVTLQTSGLHRTESELSRKDYAKAWATGTRLAYVLPRFEAGLTGIATIFTQEVNPPVRYYNRYYFRGRSAYNVALDAAWHNQRWNVRAEAAVDGDLHLAYTAQARFVLNDEWTLFAQQRHLSPRYVSLYGNTLQEGSRCVNEHGLLLGFSTRAFSILQITAFADAFYLPKPTYNNRQPTHGVDAYLRLGAQIHRQTYEFLYRFKAKERSITGYAGQSQYIQTHRFTLRATWKRYRVSCYPTLTAVWRSTQLGENSFGWMAAFRTSWKPNEAWQIGAFASLFFSDDFYSALYAYEPQLLHQGAIPSFFYHGMRLVVSARVKLPWHLEAGLRIGSTHYFNRSEISSGTELIRSSWKNDVSLQLRWTLPQR